MNAEERDRIRSKIVTDDKASPKLRRRAQHRLSNPWGPMPLADLVDECVAQSQAGTSCFPSVGAEVDARVAGGGLVRAEKITHEIVVGRHRLIVGDILGPWYLGRHPAWNGLYVALIDSEGNPAVYLTQRVVEERVRRNEVT
jgi:hypothetical protein